MKCELLHMTRAWDKEKSESPTGIEPMTSQTHGGRTIHEQREIMESKVIWSFAPAMCSGGHGFDSCRGLRFFFVPLSSHVDQFTSQIITELKIYHLYSVIKTKIVLNYT